MRTSQESVGRTQRHQPPPFPATPWLATLPRRPEETKGESVMTVELAHRDSDGIEVALLWDKRADVK
jgi:hypothetical protein